MRHSLPGRLYCPLSNVQCPTFIFRYSFACFLEMYYLRKTLCTCAFVRVYTQEKHNNRIMFGGKSCHPR